MGYRIGLDFDGTVADDAHPPVWRPGGREFVEAALAAGMTVVIHTCRATTSALLREAPGDVEEFYRTGQVPAGVEESWTYREELLDFLERWRLLGRVEVWEHPGKPFADVYVDDRAEKPDLVALAAELGLSLAGDGRRLRQGVGQPGERAA